MAIKKLISLSGTYPNVHLIGINTGMQDYRLAYFINKITSLKLERLDNLPVFNEKLKVIRNFCLYSYYDVSRRMSYYLIGNNHIQGKMIEQYSQADFFLLLMGQQDIEKNRELLTMLRQINSVTFVFVPVINKIKELDGIMQDLELHILNLSSNTAAEQPEISVTTESVYNTSVSLFR